METEGGDLMKKEIIPPQLIPPGFKTKVICTCPHCERNFEILVNVPHITLEVFAAIYGKKGELQLGQINKGFQRPEPRA